MTDITSRFRASWRYFRQGRRSDDGLTLIELIVTLLVISIVMTLSSLLIVNVNEQSNDMLDTIKGIESATGADQSLVQYLQGSTELLPLYNKAGTQIGPSATELDMVVNEGFSTARSANGWGNNEPYVSNCTNLDALWNVPTSPANADAQFVVGSDIPATGLPNTGPWNTIPADGTGPYTFSPTGAPSPCAPAAGTAIKSVSDYFALSSQSMATDPVFSYWKWGTPTGTPNPNVPPGLVSLALESGVLPAACLAEVSAVGLDVTFLAGPQTPKEGFAADQPTTLHTLVFLIGSATSGVTVNNPTVTGTCNE
jgi:prepilin-type N-terminal cleavage/methylation domain-containing protein